MTMLSYSVK